MNGRIEDAATPEARLAAVVISVIRNRKEETWWQLDYADFEQALKPYVARELLQARLATVRELRDGCIDHEGQLYRKLAENELEIARRKPPGAK
jgi:hypothetical protein